LVYVRNPRYRPRPEPASGTAGGKVVKVDRVEWWIIGDPQTQVNALRAGTVDVIEDPLFTQYPELNSNHDIQMIRTNPLGIQYLIRFNHLEPPFNNPKVRLAAMAALNQEAFLKTQVGDSAYYRTCFSVYHCGSPYASSAGMDLIHTPDPQLARKLLRESGYDGSPVILLHAYDVSAFNRLAIVAEQLLREAGFKVKLETLPGPSYITRRAQKTGWSAFPAYGTWWSEAAPISANHLSAACEKAWAGWPCDSALENLRDAFALASTDSERSSLATKIQIRAMEVVTHVPLGESFPMIAARRNITGFVTSPIMTYWNLEKR